VLYSPPRSTPVRRLHCATPLGSSSLAERVDPAAVSGVPPDPPELTRDENPALRRNRVTRLQAHKRSAGRPTGRKELAAVRLLALSLDEASRRPGSVEGPVRRRRCLPSRWVLGHLGRISVARRTRW
jgi:hypothetical protein